MSQYSSRFGLNRIVKLLGGNGNGNPFPGADSIVSWAALNTPDHRLTSDKLLNHHRLSLEVGQKVPSPSKY